MNTFFDRVAADWFTLGGLLLDHPLLLGPTIVCISAFLERATPAILWMCAWLIAGVL